MPVDDTRAIEPDSADGSALYERDFVAWARDQAERLRKERTAGSNLAIDWPHLIEEVEDLGNRHADALGSCLTVVIEHLLKLQLSPAAEPKRGWRASVTEHRTRALRLLKRNPSLKAQLPDLLADAHEDGRVLAAEGLATDGVPPAAPALARTYAAEQVLDRDWWP